MEQGERTKWYRKREMISARKAKMVYGEKERFYLTTHSFHL